MVAEMVEKESWWKDRCMVEVRRGDRQLLLHFINKIFTS